MSPRILLASTNQGKLDELQDMLAGSGIDVLTPIDLGLALTVDETGESFEENARLKAEAYAAASGQVALADDSGLEVEALEGRPGVRSARFAGERANDSDRVKLLLERLAGVPPARRGATFRAAVAVAVPGLRVRVFSASVQGTVAEEPRGEQGFGYDPIFCYGPEARTFAELSRSEKRAVSHRGQALDKALGYLEQLRADGIL